MANTIIIQGIGAIAFGVLSVSYFKKEKKQMLLVQIIAYIFFTIHYFLLNGITGAICNLIGLFALTSLYLVYNHSLKAKIISSIFFAIMLTVVNILTFQNVYSLFPMVASIISILSFLLKKENTIRAVGIISSICWLLYAIIYKSYVSIVFESITLVGVCIALFKNLSYKKHK